MTRAPASNGEHEVFPNAPLQLVAAEVTYAATELNVDTGLFAALNAVLGGNAQTQLGGTVRVSGPPDASGGAPGESILLRMTSQDQTTSVSAWPTSLIVECTDYDRYETFRSLVQNVVDAYAQYMEPAEVSRFGMRYIDELHVATPVASVADWAPYVNPVLLAPSTLVQQRVTNLVSGFSVDLGHHKTVNVRCATTPSRAMASEGPLRLRNRPDTPAFVLDIDAIYQPAGKPMIGPVTGALVTELADALRPAVRAVFDAVFTDAALASFRSTEETA